jgi:hypothetical protein
MQFATAAAVEAKLREACYRIDEALEAAAGSASPGELERLRKEAGEALSRLVPPLEAIWREHPEMRPRGYASGTRRRGSGDKRPPPRAAGEGGTLSRDTALRVQQQILDASGLLDHSIVTIMGQLDAAELKAYKLLVGTAMAEILPVLQWLWARHPDIAPREIVGDAPSR